MKPEYWLKNLKSALHCFGKTPKDWELYRGDSFQLEIKNIDAALSTAIHIKAILKSTPNLDVRMSIGIGNKTYSAKKISQSNGSAFENAGVQFDLLKKEKVNLSICSGNKRFDKEMNLFIRFALTFMDRWTTTSASLVARLMKEPGKTQLEMASLLKINQSAVSQRKKRANLDLIEDLDNYYKLRIKETFS
ncbi:MAG TPA: hypothetical protein PK110_07610 [Niabella sp.]|jgi:hypothetical protein|nr:hypothetical protein [Chitinophagaceae bacterium]HRO84673.1 hypothetical protein [Niabella sp.]HUN02210.1 hypothetical protein [Niabella sp.]